MKTQQIQQTKQTKLTEEEKLQRAKEWWNGLSNYSKRNIRDKNFPIGRGIANRRIAIEKLDDDDIIFMFKETFTQYKYN